MQVPSDVSYVRETCLKILDSLKGLNLDESTLFDIRLSAEEAIVNAMKYGNKFDSRLPVTITTSIDKNKVTITVKDEGDGFDVDCLPDPTEEANLSKFCGRGVFLIHKLMDEVHYNEKGNEVTMVKYLSQGG